MKDVRLFLIQTFHYSKKSFKRLTRNRGAMFFVFLFPVVMLLLLGWVFGGEGGGSSVGNIAVGVVNLDGQPTLVNGTEVTNGTLGDLLVDVLKSTNFTTVRVSAVGNTETNSTAMYLLSHREIDAFLVIPENFTECLSLQYRLDVGDGSTVPLPISPVVRIVVDPTDPVASQVVKQALLGVVDGFSEEYQDRIIDMNSTGDPVQAAYMQFLAHPVRATTEDADIAVVQLSWINFMVPGTLGIVILWAGLSNSARSLAQERERGTLNRLMVAPVSPAALLVGEYLYTLVVILLSAALALATGVVVFDVSLNWDLVALLVLTVLVSMSAVGPGLIITSLAKNAEAAGSIQTVVAIPLQFFTGGFFPLFMLPPAGQAFALALPYTQYSMAVTDIMVRGLGLADVGPAMVYITVVGVVLMVVGVITYYRALRRI
ncbi:MAG: hypothetical protein DRO73_08800 [Candidatus Thorarchaeota archaeon]|nr:MAG: hypothetical protein DRO73_08800 [Candidatus Thorarchaeota archaeon]